MKMATLLRLKALNVWSLTAKKPIIILMALGLFACKNKPKVLGSKPDWLLERDSMVIVMTDIHILEGARVGEKSIGDERPISAHYNKLWEKHQLTAARYDSNFAFYTKRPKLMDAIYEEVLENLSKIEAENKTRKPKKNPESEREEQDENLPDQDLKSAL